MDEKITIENHLLQYLNVQNVNNSIDYAKENHLDHGVLIGVIKSLHTEFYLTTEEITVLSWKLSEEAESYIRHGSPEVQLFHVIPKNGIRMDELRTKLPAELIKIAQGICMKNKWIRLDKKDNMVYPMVEQVTDSTVALLQTIQKENCLLTCISDADAMNLKKRKLISLQTTKSYKVMKGPNFAVRRKKQHASITKEMIESGSWTTELFKGYNLNSLGAPVGGGCLHPLLKVRTEFRQVLMNMGFQEMPTDRFVESSFWNFDALFQPQSHPARDAHDTFFLTTPKNCISVPEDYYERVRTMHEFGGHGSVGHGRGAFTREECMKNLLRTHTTAVSAQMLYRLANDKDGFKPAKFFSIDRVFRNETMDATHLAEFHQVEGLVADYDLSIGDLIGVINDFFSKIGITNIRFKPAYNPYTEPSMEIFAFHPDLKKWTEVGNSGIFRPEMLLPMGLPSNVRVIAWGLSLERPTMIKYRIKNIRDLFGHKIDLEKSRSAKLFRV